MGNPIVIDCGAQYGDLTVLSFAGSIQGHRMFRCLCTCGSQRDVRGESLRRGKATNCGCKTKELLSARFHKHGHAKAKNRSPEYKTWVAMYSRCYVPSNVLFHRYGGRGIVMCDRWRDFRNFLADMGPRPFPNAQLDRVDNDGPYSPENCRWASPKQQNRNKSATVLVEFEGKFVPLIALSERFGVPRSRLYQRVRSGWPIERALSEPVHKLK